MAAKENIPFIHNYCDRWCERCTFTSRCAIYENPDDVPEEEKDLKNSAFWNKISNNFANAIVMLKKAAEEYGIDIENIPQEELELQKQKEEDIRQLLKKHPLSILSSNYAKQTGGFLKENILTQKLADLTKQLALGIITASQVQEDIDNMSDCVEIVSWYEHFIYVKLQRALHGQMEDDGWELKNGYQRDFDGSAKIALLSAERSIAAWSILLHFLPEEEDRILVLLAMLQKTQKGILHQFPGAMKFIRPGFDEGPG